MKKIIVGICLAAAIGLWQAGVPEWMDTASSAVPAAEVPQPQSSYVYISGAVRRPGLYAFDKTVRVGEALHTAGGMLAYADTAAVNLAEEVKDGMHIHVSYDLNGVPVPAPEEDGRININDADEKKLSELPGIGPAMAGKIIAYREEHGPFSRIEELQQVKGIGPAKYKELQDKVTI